MTYIDPNDVATALGIDLTVAETNLVQQLIERASSIINNYCRTDFNRHTDGEDTLDGHEDLEWVYVEHAPLISVSSVTHNGSTLTVNEDYWVYIDVGAVRFLKGIITDAEPKNVVISYTYGYNSVPEGIRHICLQMVTNGFNKFRQDYLLEGASMGQISNMNIQFDQKSLLSPEIEHQLKQWKQIKLTVIK